MDLVAQQIAFAGVIDTAVMRPGRRPLEPLVGEVDGG
jgi:hypothetical protein